MQRAMRYLGRNFLPILVGLAAVLVAIASVVVIVDRLRDDDDPQLVVRAGPFRLELDGLDEALEELDLQGLDFGELDLGELNLEDLDGLLALARAFGERLERSFGDRVTVFAATGETVLGVRVEQHEGAIVVREVLPRTPAAEAHLREGDEILRVAGHRVRSIDELQEALAAVEPGHGYELQLRRDGERLTLDVQRRETVAAAGDPGQRLREQLNERLREGLRNGLREQLERFARPAGPGQPLQPAEPLVRPAQPAAAQLGITAVQTDEGVRVVQVVPDGGASAAGLRPGDRILAVADRPVDSIDALRARLRDFAPGETVTVVVQRGDGRHELRVRLSPQADRAQRAFVPPGQQRRDAAVPEGAFLELFAQLPDDARARFLDLVADFVAERLAERAGDAAADAPRTDAASEAELTAFFGRVAAVDDGSITLDGSAGAITLALTADTTFVGGSPSAGDLVTAVTRDGVVGMLIVIG